MDGQLLILLTFIAGLVIGATYTNYLRDRAEAMLFEDIDTGPDKEEPEDEDDEDDDANWWKKGRNNNRDE